ncbi:GTP-binding protein [Oscillatoria sp. CS-180]|uniref:GTP-binding protein n=1 Tax=Oscillatoria sp. CS-180 TaxID=3021720 RepID=UPI00232CA5F3|nr:GTP-binding protein [Oscillatoria sp. CS-180]MDB9528546.1 GTP-binding protein [Oscillatoria sp. CS-180]
MPTPAKIRFQRVRQVLQQTVHRYTPTLQKPLQNENKHGQKVAVQDGVNALSALDARLAKPVLRMAVFGLVSRGKSAVINALLGENVLPTGPLHGVTRWPRSVYWQPSIDAVHDLDELPQIELIDTPGLDEVDGEVRSSMAQEVAHQADLILFVVAGDITRTEYDALTTLQEARKPLLLVFNKIDLYPDTDQQAIYDVLTQLWRASGSRQPNAALAVDDIVMIAADPMPMQVRVEWPDGRITHEWEKLPPQIDDLKHALLTIARQDGTALIALNALREADTLETDIARRAIALHREEAEELIWKFAKYKALAVALNPIAVLDLAGGFLTDLVMIRSLAKLYGLPITQHEARKLWQAIAKSSGTLLLSEVGTGLLLGTGKGAAAIWSAFDSAGGFSALISVMAAQAGASGYGTYAVGKAAQVYLEQGCTWGPNGVKAVMKDILKQIDSESTVSRLRQELESQLMASSSR